MHVAQRIDFGDGSATTAKLRRDRKDQLPEEESPRCNPDVKPIRKNSWRRRRAGARLSATPEPATAASLPPPLPDVNDIRRRHAIRLVLRWREKRRQGQVANWHAAAAGVPTSRVEASSSTAVNVTAAGSAVSTASPTVVTTRSTVVTARSTVGTTSPTVVTARSTVGTANSTVGTISPTVGTAKSTVGTACSIVGTTSPIVGTTGPTVGSARSTVSTASPTIGTDTAVHVLASDAAVAAVAAAEAAIQELRVAAATIRPLTTATSPSISPPVPPPRRKLRAPTPSSTVSSRSQQTARGAGAGTKTPENTGTLETVTTQSSGRAGSAEEEHAATPPWQRTVSAHRRAQ